MGGRCISENAAAKRLCYCPRQRIDKTLCSGDLAPVASDCSIGVRRHNENAEFIYGGLWLLISEDWQRMSLVRVFRQCYALTPYDRHSCLGAGSLRIGGIYIYSDHSRL
jgi:hypothetical protein